MTTSKFYKTTSHGFSDSDPVTDGETDKEETLLITRSIGRDMSEIKTFGQVFTASERAVLPGLAITVSNDTNQSAERWSMFTLDGQSLRDIIDKAKKIEEYSDRGTGDLVMTLVHAANAVSYANEQDIYYHNLSPENIIVNRRGDVSVVQSSSLKETAALQINKNNIDPMYYSPEQARGETASAASNVYSLGAILLEIITLRPPISSSMLEELWELRRKGFIDRFTDRELESVHPAMAAIVNKAIDPNANMRYACVDALRNDLMHFFADKNIYAYHNEPLMERIGRNLKTYKVMCIIVSVMVLSMCAIGLSVYTAAEKEKLQWILVDEEAFSDTSIEEISKKWSMYTWPNWTEGSEISVDLNEPGILELLNGGLCIDTSSKRRESNNFIYQPRIVSNMRVTWDYIPLQDGENLNCFIGGSNRWNGYTFHLASHGDLLHGEITREMKPLITKQLPRPFEVGRSYRFTMEKLSDTIRLLIDGEVILEAHDVFMLNGNAHQQFGFEQISSRTLIDNIQVWRQSLPYKTNRIEIAHALAGNKDFAAAIEYYKNIITQFPQSDMAAQSFYHSALCMQKLQQYPQSIEMLNRFLTTFKGHELREYVLGGLAESYLAMNEIGKAEDCIDFIAISSSSSEQLKVHCLRMLAQYYGSEFDLKNLIYHPNGLTIAQMLLEKTNVWERKLGVSSNGIQTIAAWIEVLYLSGHYQEILDAYPSHRELCGRALVAMHKPQEALERYGYMATVSCQAYIALGEYNKFLAHATRHNAQLNIHSLLALSRYSVLRRLSMYGVHLESRIQVAMGNYKKALQFDSRNTNALLALHMLDRIPDLRESRSSNHAYEEVMMRSGRVDELLARKHTTTATWFYANIMKSIELAQKKDVDVTSVSQLMSAIRTVPYPVNTNNFEKFIIPDMIEFFVTGERDVLLEQFRQRTVDPRLKYSTSIAGARAIVTGDPPQYYRTSMLSIVKKEWRAPILMAFHYELNKDNAAAVKYYTESKRLLPPYAPVAFRNLIDWRLDELR